MRSISPLIVAATFAAGFILSGTVQSAGKEHEEGKGTAAEKVPSFSSLDLNQDGSLNRAEAAMVVDLDFEAADKDKDGTLSKEEYQAAVEGKTEKAGPEAKGEKEKPETQAATGAYPLPASQLIGKEVRNPQGEDIGEIDDLIIKQGNVSQAVISVGGFLGIGEHSVAVLYDELEFGPPEQGYVTYSATREQLEAMPEFKYEEVKPGVEDVKEEAKEEKEEVKTEMEEEEKEAK